MNTIRMEMAGRVVSVYENELREILEAAATHASDETKSRAKGVLGSLFPPREVKFTPIVTLTLNDDETISIDFDWSDSLQPREEFYSSATDEDCETASEALDAFVRPGKDSQHDLTVVGALREYLLTPITNDSTLESEATE